MCQGRCPGCGATGPHRVIIEHTISCPDVAALVKAGTQFLDPVAEYARYREQDAPAAKAEARQVQVDVTDAARAAMAERFRTRDPLEE